ncbi:amidohydrolase [Bradyrhizobium jicamae]|uniref:amidohydrolase family protein n=1 Tax=Bradyrhizobium jicamae TaxID=280332 RepID=UPI001BA54BCC|nr:amidohydrolase family protein [Bradyrhizobium jicamae]MBR0755324.1 amidohydrolase [Bradyrhizobium jicamae]
MKDKVALEEHFALEETLGDSQNFVGPETWQDLRARLLDIRDMRIREMDKHGIAVMILSLNSPAIQAISDHRTAAETARRANDILAAEIAKSGGRFKGLAALPMQDPQAASLELSRCVHELGFKGALVNGYSQVGPTSEAVYYDVKPYWDFWEVVERLGVPFYLHPREPSERKAYVGHPWLIGPAYGFGSETALHALRLMGSGLFDKFPALKIILGHLGEALPFTLYRIDQRIAWSPLGYPAKKKVSEYFSENFYITTAGNFRTQSLVNSLLEVGADRILFSTDYPFEQVSEATEWFESAAISERDREKIGRTNAVKLFQLD